MALTVKVAWYVPGGVVDGMTSVSLAPNLDVPTPYPAVAFAHVEAPVRPGVAPGVMTEPAITLFDGVVCDRTEGVQPRSLPGKLCDPKAKLPTCPDTVHPGTVFRVVVTWTGVSVPWLDSVDPLTLGRVMFTTAWSLTVSLKVPCSGMVWVIVSVPDVLTVLVVVGVLLYVVVPGAVAVVILYGNVPDDPENAVLWVGVNVAVTVYVPTTSVVSVT
jgi:hypothetical protein